MRRILCSMIIAIVALSTVGSCFASTNSLNSQNLVVSDSNVIAYSEEFPEAYLETEYVDFSGNNIYVKDGILKVNSLNRKVKSAVSLINSDEQRKEEAIEAIENGKDLVGVASVTAYVVETYEGTLENPECIESRLLTKEEYQKEWLDAPTDGNVSTASWDLYDDKTKSKNALTINLNVYTGGTTKERYLLAGTATWKEGSSVTGGRPAKGDDYISFIWGGGFDYKDEGCVVTSNKSGQSLKCYETDASPNRAFVWGVQEYKYSPNYGNIYAKNISAGITLTKSKLTGGGNTTSTVLKYIHTYEGTKGSIEIAASSESIGGSVSLSGVDKQWSIVASISQLKY